MKARRIAQTMTALALAATMTAPMTAFALDTGTNNVKGEDVNSEQSGTTPISLDVEPVYTVTIPAEIKLTDDDTDGYYTGKSTIFVEDVHLEYGKQLQVSVGKETSFELTDDNAAKIEYEVATTEDGTALDAGGQIATFKSTAGTDVEQSKEVFFKTPEAITNAGDFKGNITFTFSVIDE